MSNCKFFDYHHYLESKIQFKRPTIAQISNENYYFIPIRYKNREIYIKTPKIVAPFGLNTYTTDSNDKFYYCVLSFTDMDIDVNIEKFYLFLQRMEKYCQNEVSKNLKKWGCDYPFDKLNFKSGFKDSNGSPLFRFKITHTGKQMTELYNEKGEQQDISDIEFYLIEHCQVINLLELQNIWINSTEYGITWKIRQMRVYPSTRPIGGISLLDENIGLHVHKVIERTTTEIIESTNIPDAPPVPDAPPLSPPSDEERRPKKPIGGFAVLPFLVAIKDGIGGLKKVDPNTKSNGQSKKDQFPEISLKEILDIRQKLKKSNPEPKTDAHGAKIECEINDQSK